MGESLAIYLFRKIDIVCGDVFQNLDGAIFVHRVLCDELLVRDVLPELSWKLVRREDRFRHSRFF